MVAVLAVVAAVVTAAEVLVVVGDVVEAMVDIL